MRQKNPELPPDSEYFDPNQAAESEQSTPLTDYEEKYLKKLHKRRRRRRIVGGTALASVFIGFNAYWLDVYRNIAIEEQAKPGITFIAPPLDPENSHKALIVFNGFNTVDADYFSKTNAEALQQNGDGNILSIQYNNSSFDGNTFFDTVETYLVEHDITEANFTFVSAGNVAGSRVGAKIAEETDISIGSLQHYMSPSGSDGVKPFRKEEMQAAEFVAQWVPGSENSTFWRIVVEQYFYLDQYTKGAYNGEFFHDADITLANAERFMKVGWGILNRFNNGDYTSNSFLLKQIAAINDADLEEDYITMSQASDDVAIYWRGKYDSIVDQEISVDQLRSYTNAGGMPLLDYDIPNASHTEYWVTKKEFKETASTVAAEIPEAVEAYQQRYNTDLLTLFYDKNFASGPLDAEAKTNPGTDTQLNSDPSQ